MDRKLQFMILLLMFVAGCAKENPLTPEDSAELYFPLATGNRWVYDYTYRYLWSDTTISYAVQLVVTDTLDSIQWYGVNYSSSLCFGSTPGDGETRLMVSCDRVAGDGAKIIRKRNQELYESRKTIHDFPALPGKMIHDTSFDNSYVDTSGKTLYDYGFSKRFYLKNDTVAIGNYRFSNCIHVRDSVGGFYTPRGIVHLTNFGNIKVSDEWYAPNVGLVRQIFTWTHYYINREPEKSIKKLELRTYKLNS